MPQNQEFNPYAAPTTDIDQGLVLGGDDYVLADRGTRLGAAVIDALLILLSMAPGFILLFSSVAGLSANPLRMFDGAGADDVFLIVGVTAVLFLALQILQWYLIATTGQSLAKRWLGIKIVKTDGTPCGFVNGVLLRSWVLHFVSNVIPGNAGSLVHLVDALFIFAEDRRCLHDHIAGTRVIVAPTA